MKESLLILFVLLTNIAFNQIVDSKCDSVLYSVTFNSGDHSINTYADSVLQIILLEIDENDISEIQLVGHTDKHGSIEYNKALSKRRVEEVERFLLDYLDIELSTDFYGESKPKDLDTTKQSDQSNRRVEIKCFINCNSPEDNNNSIIYQQDQNCHIDSFITNNHYSKTLLGKDNSSVLVIDWTRSMYTYGLQLLKWFEINEGSASFDEIFIFNDGDGKPTSKKMRGSTGGIYKSEMNDLTAVIELMEAVAKKGTGGDYPENYIEALLAAERASPNVDTLILIADNRACIRDYKLLDSLNLPVIVILNEIDTTNRLINYQYINLIAQNGGRIVFMNSSLSNIKFKNNQGFKPIYFNDTLIKLPKIRGDLDDAYEKIAQMKKEQMKTSIPPILLIDGKETASCYNNEIPNTNYKIGCALCKKYDYKIKTHTTFQVKYTFRQKIQLKWRNRLRARFKVVDYKWRKIKCTQCKKINDKKERKNCNKKRIQCNKEKRTCKKNKIRAKKNLKKFKKNRRKQNWKSFKNFFKFKKSKSTSKKTTKTKSEKTQ